MFLPREILLKKKSDEKKIDIPEFRAQHLFIQRGAT